MTENKLENGLAAEVAALTPIIQRMARKTARAWPSGSFDELDLAQEGVIALMEATVTYDPKRGPFRHYALRAASYRMAHFASRGVVMTGARRASIRERRVVASTVSIEHMHEVASLVDVDAQEAAEYTLEILMAGLDEEAQRVISLRYGLGTDADQYTISEIAEVADLSERQVTVALWRGMRNLRRAALPAAA